MFRHALAVGAALLAASSLVAADTPAKCSLTNKCPKEAPCCSQYGECGVGAYCLGGCDPRMSFSMEACLPSPVCVDKEYKMDSLDGIVDVSKYLGDASKADWVAQGTPLEYNGNVLLTMAPKTSGTVLSSTHYMWFGEIEITLKTSRGAGVVSAFILFSDVKDEIDYEWVGVDLNTAQTNYYFQGITDYTKSGNLTIPSNSYENFHTYKVKWTPDEIKYIIDGDESKARTVQKSKTWNATLNRFDYPQTPARIQISLWPGGREDNAKGTIDWAGGVIDWNHQEVKDHGYYYATLGKVTMKCWNGQSAPGTNKNKGYYYNDIKATNDTVVDGQKSTIIKSLIATGLDTEKDYPSSAGTASQSVQQVIPGVVGGGAGFNGQAPPEDSGNNGNGGGSGSGGTGSGSSSCSGSGFQQSCGGNSGSKNDGVRKERAFGASAFAALVAVAGMIWL